MYFYILFSLQVALVLATNNVQSVSFVRRSSRKIKLTQTKEELTGLGLFECILVCVGDLSCDKCAWHAISKRCQIGKDLYQAWRTYNSRLEVDAEWTSYEKMRFPVSYYAGPSGAWIPTLQDAIDTCVIMGSTVSSPQNLLQARANGYSNCGCGWLSDGSKGCVLQVANPICLNTFNTGIIYCSVNSQAYVYCTVP